VTTIRKRVLFVSRIEHIIHISTQNVSFSILIGQNSVAEWLIVASINHKNSNQKQPTNLSQQVAL